jgi:hypothetical protein
MNKVIVRAPSAAHKQSGGDECLPTNKYAPREQSYFLHLHGMLHDEWGDGIEDFAPSTVAVKQINGAAKIDRRREMATV